jgi:hypothetical protein
VVGCGGGRAGARETPDEVVGGGLEGDVADVLADVAVASED